MVRIYGIKNCDTVRKARKWLSDHGVVHEYHDFRTDGLPEDRLQVWLDTVGWETLLNRRGLAWRKLADEKKRNVDSAKALELIREEPTLIKRPVLEYGGTIKVGFTEADYAEIFR